MVKSNIWLCIPPLCAIIIDTSCSAMGQNADYWGGNRGMVIEGNPVVHFFMSHHWLGLFIIGLLWIALIIPLIYFTNRRISMIITLSVVIGNSWGAATWLSRYNFWYIIILFVLIIRL